MTKRPPADAIARLRAWTLEANLDAVGAPVRTRRAVLGATPRGSLVLLEDGNPAVEAGGRIVGAPAEPVSADRSVADVREAGDGVAVVLGIGAGHTARDLCERTRARVVVFEPDAGLLRTVLEAGPVDLGGVPVVCDPLDLAALWPDLAGAEAAATLVRTPGYAQAFPEADAAIAESVRALVADVSLFETTRAFRFRSWLEDIFANVDVLCETGTILALGGAYAGVPAFVVGAGPSLARNVSLLGEAARKGIVIAVDVAGRVLARAGVVPQILVALEALSHARYVEELPWIDEVVRAMSLTAHPSSLRAGRGPLLPFFELLQQFRPIADLVGFPPLPVGGSVSTVAFSIAERMGCSPIVLAGQDLAYTGGRTHAEGSAFEKSRARVDTERGRIVYDWCDVARANREGQAIGPPQRHEPLFEVPAWGGGGVATSTSAFNAYRKWFESMADAMAAARPEVALVNASEGGSRIRGFAERPLAQVLADLPDRPVGAADIAARASQARPPLARADVAAWADGQADLARDACRAARRLGRQARAARRRIDAPDAREVSGALRYLEPVEIAFRAACAAQPMLDGWSYASMHNLLVRAKDRPAGAEMRDEAAWGLDTEEKMAAAIAAEGRGLERALRAVARRMRVAAGATARDGQPET